MPRNFLRVWLGIAIIPAALFVAYMIHMFRPSDPLDVSANLMTGLMFATLSGLLPLTILLAMKPRRLDWIIVILYGALICLLMVAQMQSHFK